MRRFELGDKTQSVYLFSQMLFNLSEGNVHAYRYTSEYYEFAFAIHGKSTAAYKVLRTVLPLPCDRMLRELSSRYDTMNDSAWGKALFATFTDLEKIGHISVDEVHCARRIDYRNGKSVGFASNNEDVEATTMLGLMYNSVCGNKKVLLKLQPMNKIIMNIFHI